MEIHYYDKKSLRYDKLDVDLEEALANRLNEYDTGEYTKDDVEIEYKETIADLIKEEL